MTDVREICDVVLDVPAPPVPDVRTALAMAREATKRRNRAASAAAALVVMVGAGVVAIPALAAPSPAWTTLREPLASSPVRVAPVPVIPGADAAQAHGDQIAALLLAAVPGGYTGTPEYAESPTSTFHIARTPSSSPSLEAPSDSAPQASLEFTSVTSVVVSQGNRQGLLEANLARDNLPVPEDLCATTRFDAFFGPAQTCQAIVIDGAPIRVATHLDASVGAVTVAARALKGGVLLVFATQGRWNFGHDESNLPPDAVTRAGSAEAPAPPLDVPALSGAQLAALAANPGMLP